jgi:hypothetical protein
MIQYEFLLQANYAPCYIIFICLLISMLFGILFPITVIVNHESFSWIVILVTVIGNIWTALVIFIAIIYLVLLSTRKYKELE